MTEFKGFPAKMIFTPVPNLVFSSLLPQITDIVELKVLLHIFGIIYPKRSSLKFTTFKEMLGDAGLVNDLKGQVGEDLTKALAALVSKGILLTLPIATAEAADQIYLFNNETNRLSVERILSGELVLPGLKAEKPAPAVAETPADIFTLYEQNIGMLTPLIADELREAGKQYPEDWIKDAIKEAVSLNKRNWRYIARILEHWLTEGRDDGTHRGNLKKNTDPDKFIKGRYGHLVQR
jgi:DnaD/phage-associated family protein